MRSTQPLDPCALNAPGSAAFHGVGKLKGQERAALLPFFLPVISLLFYVGILLVPM